jgi:hypothetical protein
MTREFLTVALAAALVATLVADVSAQSSNTIGPPAEYPPSTFEGRQFVDSRGCVYVRAGVDGAVNWVPRVSREREVICGQTPTFARHGSEDATQAEPVEVAQSEPVIITPQPAAPKTRARGASQRSVKAKPQRQTTAERIVPKHVYDAQGDTLPPVPKGYKRAWEDDRLNPHRAHMTREGHRATQQVLSNTVPRRSLTAPQNVRKPKIVGRGKGLGH